MPVQRRRCPGVVQSSVYVLTLSESLSETTSRNIGYPRVRGVGDAVSFASASDDSDCEVQGFLWVHLLRRGVPLHTCRRRSLVTIHGSEWWAGAPHKWNDGGTGSEEWERSNAPANVRTTTEIWLSQHRVKCDSQESTCVRMVNFRPKKNVKYGTENSANITNTQNIQLTM